jgi:gas vesicle protein
MEKRSRLWDGILIGALVGAAVSMFDKQTREHVLEGGRKLGSQVAKTVKNPKETQEALKEKFNEFKETVEHLSEDVSFIAGKVDEIRELTPQVVDIVKETKEVFSAEESDEHAPHS